MYLTQHITALSVNHKNIEQYVSPRDEYNMADYIARCRRTSGPTNPDTCSNDYTCVHCNDDINTICTCGATLNLKNKCLFCDKSLCCRDCAKVFNKPPLYFKLPEYVTCSSCYHHSRRPDRYNDE